MSLIVEQSILGFCLNPELRATFNNHLQPWMFKTDWAGSFLACLQQPAYDGVVPNMHEFIAALHNLHKVSQSDCEAAANVFLDYNETSARNPSRIIDHVQEWIREAYLTSGLEVIASGNEKDYRSKGIELVSTGISFQLGVDEFDDFTDDAAVEAARQEDLPPNGAIIPSSYSIINRSLSYKGYKYGDLVMVTAESGVGKSTVLITESAHFLRMGFRVAHIVLGDLSRFDVYAKYMANLCDVDFEEILATGHTQYAQDPTFRDCMSRLRVKVFDPDTHDIYQLIAKVGRLRQKFEFDVLIVDYDGNIKDASNSGSSYIEGGAIYANLKGYGRKRCVVFVAAQTKIQYWGEEIILKNFANDSSKKQHHLDLMIGVGPNKEFRGVGTLNLAKVRRGIADRRSRIAFEGNRSRIVEITQAEYDKRIQRHKLNATNLSYDYESLLSGGQDTQPATQGEAK